MTWLLRHRLRNYWESSLWLAPALAIPSAIVFAKLVRVVAAQTQWTLAGIGPDGARALLGAYVGATLSFIVFVFSMLLLAVQIASTQLSPRIIGSLLRDAPPRFALTVFVFASVYDMGAMARIEENMVELPVFVATGLTIASVLAFLYLIDYMARSLKPVSVVSRIGAYGLRVVDHVYPRLLGNHRVNGSPPASDLDAPARSVAHDGPAGVLLAFDVAGLVALARRMRCVLEVVPQVGDFVAKGEPLFHVHGAAGMDEAALRHAVALGPERTMEQDPAFCFRILTEIASKALSPAINDPSTAVLALDQIHRLLRSVALRELDTGYVHDRDGALRLVYRTPDWEDFVDLSVSEIRLFGCGSLQVVRRLRAMLDNILTIASASRAAALRAELELLRRAVERSFADPEDRARASIGDLQGVGGSSDADGA